MGLGSRLDSVNVASYVAWGLCWKWLLVPVSEISLYDSTKAVFAGQFANELLPARLGNLLGPIWHPLDFRRIRNRHSLRHRQPFAGRHLVRSRVAVTAFFVHLPKDLLLADPFSLF